MMLDPFMEKAEAFRMGKLNLKIVVGVLLASLTFPALGALPQFNIGSPFPHLELFDQNGKNVSLEQYKGKVLLIEPIGFSCSACQALTGAHKAGGFEKVNPQPGLKSIDEYIQQFGKGANITDSRMMFIQIVFYNNFKHAPSKEDLKKWIRHFKMDRSSNFLVLGAEKKYADGGADRLIPGFFLVDKNFVLKYNATTKSPVHNLYTELIPNIKNLL